MDEDCIHVAGARGILAGCCESGNELLRNVLVGKKGFGPWIKTTF
jgi:hypothetical protein